VGSDNTFRYFRAILTPKFWSLSLSRDSRIWQRKSVIEILHSVLENVDTVFQTSETYLVHNYCVQYRESHFHFANRMMEEEGIYYYFTHAADKHQLVVSDHSPNSPDLEGQVRFHYDYVQGGIRDEARIYRWETSQSLVSGGHVLWDHQF